MHVWKVLLGICVAYIIVARGVHATGSRTAGSSVKALFRAAFSGDFQMIDSLLRSKRADPNAESGSKTALVAALEGAHAAFDRHWPGPGFNGTRHVRSLESLLQHGADPAVLCPTLEAVTYRNVRALRLLLARMNSSSVNECVSAGDGLGRNLMHNLAASPAAGLSRLFFRAAKLGIDHPARTTLEDELSINVSQFTPDKEISKAQLEDSIGTADLDAVIDAASRAGMDFVALLSERDSRGYTPLLTACEHGRVAVVKKLLELGADPLQNYRFNLSEPGTKGIPPAPREFTCAHLAAVRGHTDILRVLNAHFGAKSLTAWDFMQRSPCSVASSFGPVMVAVTQYLCSVDACPGQSEACGICQPGSSCSGDRSSTDAAPVRLRRFDPAVHSAAGWRLVNSSLLAKLKIDDQLWLSENLDASKAGARQPRAGPDFPGSGTTRSWQHPVTILPAATLADNSGLVALFLQLAKPFLIQQAFNPMLILGAGIDASGSTAIGPNRTQDAAAAANDASSTLYITRKSLLKRFGHLNVTSSELPYASSYGGTAEKTSVRAFVKEYMGSRSRRKAAARQHSSSDVASVGVDPQAQMTSEENASREKLSHPPAGGPDAVAFDGPGSTIATPPYVFDGTVMRSPASSALFAPFVDWLPDVFGKNRANLLQFILGPPLSGAMPHFHGPAVNVLFFGLKLWILFPPSHAAFADAHVRTWYEQTYLKRFAALSSGNNPLNAGHASLHDWQEGSAGDDADLMRVPHFVFLQEPGDLVYVPQHWGHAVLNLADSFAIALE